MALVEFLGHELVSLAIVDHSGVECLSKHTRFVVKFRKGEYTAIDDGLL